MMKRIFSFLLTLLLLVSLLPTGALQAGATAEEPLLPMEETQPEAAEPPKKASTTSTGGTCGENLTWRIADNLNLIISGTGPMYDYTAENPAPWADVTTNRYVVLPQGLTRIGDYAFATDSYNVGIPRSVTQIGSNAFRRYNHSITFLGGAIDIAADAFADANCTLFYRAGWNEEDRQTFGAKKATWSRFNLSSSGKTKLIYQLDEPILPEDFRLIPSSNSRYTYIPQVIQTGTYDNSTCGEKSVTVMADGFSFTHNYLVIDGDYRQQLKIDLPLQYYDPKGVTPDPVVTVGPVQLKKGTHYTLSYKNNDRVGTDATLTVTGLGQFADFKKTLPMPILKQDISEGGTSVHITQYFNGMPLTPTPEVIAAGDYLSPGKDFITYYENNTNVGTATYRVVGIGNYCGTLTKTFPIKEGGPVHELTGTKNGNLSYGPIDMEKYTYTELVLAPGTHTFQIDHAINNTSYELVASYNLYRFNGVEYQLVKSLETELGKYSQTAFRYTFSDAYDSEAGGAVYMLAYSFVNVRNDLYSGMCSLLFPAKVPEATTLVPELVDVVDFRHGYITAYGLDGNVGNVTWSSSDPTVATIQNGVFTMHKPGEVELIAKYGSLQAGSRISVIAEDLSQGELFAFDPATGKATVLYDGRLLQEGTDYTLETAKTGGLWEVAATGTGVFTGQLLRYFTATGDYNSHSHGFASTCDAGCVRCDLQREPETEHLYETKKDSETHWQLCRYCAHKKDEAPHIYAGGNSKLCTQCGDIPAAPEPPTYEYPPSDTDADRLSKAPVPGSTVAVGYNGFILSADRGGMGFASIPGKTDSTKLAVTDGMALLEVRAEGTAYLLMLNGKYLTCGLLGNSLYLADQLTDYGRWYMEETENGNFRILNGATELALSFLGSFSVAPTEDNPVCSLQLYRVSDVPVPPSNVTRLETPVLLTPESNSVDGTCLLEWISVPYADAYEVYRSTSKTGTYTKIATVHTAYYREEISSGHSYYYKVKAVCGSNTAINSAFSLVASFSGQLVPPTVQMALNKNTGRMVFTWEAVTGAKEYEIYRAEQDGAFVKVGTTSKLTYTDTKATPTVTYRYAFRSISANSSHNSGLSSEYTCRHLPAPPKVTIKLDSKLSCPVVSWDKVDGATKYTIYYKYPGDTEFRTYTNYQGTSMTFNSAPGDSECIFRVYPLGDEYVPYESLLYTEVSIVTGIATPTLICHVSDGHIKATWEAVNGAVKYELYRSTSEKKGYTLLATLTDTLEYLDTDTPVGKKFYYKVVAVGNLSRSKDSHVTGIAAICKRPVVTAQRNEKGKPMLSWEKVEGAKQYTVYYGTASYNMKKLGTTKSLSYTHTGAKAGTTYYYWVIANGPTSGSNSTNSIPVTCSVGSGTPVVSAKADAATGKPSLSWGKVEGAVKYRIYRQLPGEAEFSVLTEQTATSYLDSAVPIDTQCIYKVQALGKTTALDGDPSREISIASGIARPSLTATVDAVTGKPVFTWTTVEGAVKYEIYRSTKSTKSYSLLATLEAPGYTDESVAPGKTYYYKLVAVGNVGKSAETAYVKLTGKCATPTITAENGSTGKPVISWEKVSGAKKYTVYRATSETGKYSKLTTTSKLTYTDSKAKAGSTYFYKIVANGSKSTYNSPYSNIVSCNVICGTPSVTLKLDAATGKPVLSWKKVDGATSYRILRQLPGEEDFTVIAEQTALTFKDETAPIDTLCVYRVQAVGAHELLDGAYSKMAEATSGIARPSLQTAIDANGKPQLTWEPIEGAVKYEIYRSTKSTKSYKLLTTVEVPGYTDDSVAPGKTYYYKVVAIGQVSKSAETAYVKLTGKCATPEIAAEVDYFSGRPVISWQKVTGAKKYTVYRATSETGKYKKLGTTTKLTYTDTKATVATTYYYKIVANASSSKYNSGYSNLVSCTPTCAVPAIKVATAAATGKPVLSWKKVTGAVSYEIWLEQAGAMELLTSTTKLTFTDESIVPGETKIYWVYAVDALGRKSGEWAVATATCPQPKPTGKAGETGKPELTWEAVEGATRYVIYRSTSKSKGYKAIDETDALTFTDTTAKKGKTYYYKVVALCEETESAQSAYVKIKSK